MSYFWQWLVSLYQSGRRVEIVFNGIVYDTDFVYNSQNDILTAKSSTNSNASFGSSGKNIVNYVTLNLIKITIN